MKLQQSLSCNAHPENDFAHSLYHGQLKQLVSM